MYYIYFLENIVKVKKKKKVKSLIKNNKYINNKKNGILYLNYINYISNNKYI
jgi:hypothetical protein